jgi:hypothetical protein
MKTDPVIELAATADAEPLLIDTLMPTADAAIAVHEVVAADPEAAWRAAMDLDFLTVHTPLMDAAFWVRGAPAMVSGWWHGTPPPPPPPQMRLGDSMRGGGIEGWEVLGEHPGRETVFGAIGRFWTPQIEWRAPDPDGFASFDEPGWGKIACNFSVRPYGASRTLLTYEVRTVTTDAESRRTFLRYWWLIRPFVAHIMRASLRTIAEPFAPREGEGRSVN